MLDKLDKRILEIIDNAPSIVRSISERELKVGVLFPSVTTMDIKRNLPPQIDLNVVEGRLNTLENEGHIYFESKRWWLTKKGKEVLGKKDLSTSYQTSPLSKPMSKILEETFTQFESPREEPSQHKEFLNLRRELLKEIEELKEKLKQKKLKLKELNNVFTGE
jgi:hypothetical protein